jgi:hypothetical protein
MGKISDRLSQIIANGSDLSPLAAPVRDRLLDGNKEMILAGQTPDGRPADPLKPETLKRRKGSGPPRAPRGAASRVIADCVVAVFTAGGRLSFTKSWPHFGAAVAGMDRKRPTMGFRRADLDWTFEKLREHVMKGK